MAAPKNPGQICNTSARRRPASALTRAKANSHSILAALPRRKPPHHQPNSEQHHRTGRGHSPAEDAEAVWHGMHPSDRREAATTASAALQQHCACCCCSNATRLNMFEGGSRRFSSDDRGLSADCPPADRGRPADLCVCVTLSITERA
jgi:hypothetical protein